MTFDEAGPVTLQAGRKLTEDSASTIIKLVLYALYEHACSQLAPDPCLSTAMFRPKTCRVCAAKD